MRPAPGSPGAARMRAHHPTAAGRTSGRRPPGTGWCAPPLRSKVAQARHRETPRMPGHRPPRSTAGTTCSPSPCQCSCSFPRSPPVPQPGILRHPTPHCIHQHRIVGVLTPPAENAPVPREVWISTAPARRPEPLLLLFHSCCGRSRGMANPGCVVHPRGRGGTLGGPLPGLRRTPDDSSTLRLSAAKPSMADSVSAVTFILVFRSLIA